MSAGAKDGGRGRGPATWGRPQAIAAAFEKDGFRAGAGARPAKEDFLHLVDRRKGMYISGRENVYPAGMEAVIACLEEVRDVGVASAPAARWGEVGWAFIAAAPRPSFTIADPLSHHNELRRSTAR